MTPQSHAIDLSALCWPEARVGEALHALAEATGMALRTPLSGVAMPGSQPHATQATQATLTPWLQGAARALGLEAEGLSTRIADIDALIQHAGPALWRLPLPLPRPLPGDTHLLLILRSRGQRVRVLGPDGRVHQLPATALRQAMLTHIEAPFEPVVQALIDRAGIAPRRQARVRAAMMHEHLGDHALGEAWLLRLPPTAPFIAQLKQAGSWAQLRHMLGMFAALYALELLGWGLIGRATLDGRPDTGWWLAWALLMATLIPMRLLGQWLDASLSTSFGRVLKARLMAGALDSDLGTLKQHGSGSLLALVMESQALESLAAQGGFSALIAALELMYAALVLMAGAGGLGHVALLASWLVLGLWLVRRFHVRLSGWTASRLGMTRRWVEHLVGHRSKLVQAHGQRHHHGDDEALNAYAAQSRAMDDSLLPILTLLPRGWLLIGLLGLAPALMRAPSHSANATGLALSLGGLMLAYRALDGWSMACASLSRAWIAWRAVKPLFTPLPEPVAQMPIIAVTHPTASTHSPSAPELTAPITSHTAPHPLLQVSQLASRHAGANQAVFQGVNLRVHSGERLLLEGASGSGKSTLAAILTGLREADAGLVQFKGWDRHTLGSQWRRWVTQAPQFHDNHIFSASLAFNLLMGRQWPPSPDDLREAQAVCEELGLGDLIERMPAGLMQHVGETGWRLSHGEASRVHLARALLQGAPITILDECFAALDPATLKQAMRCAWQRTEALLVVAHP